MTEVIHSMLEEGPTVCERCGGELRRVLYPSGIIFKGSGFYRTDSRSAKAQGGGTDPGVATSGDAGSTSGDGSSKVTKGTDAGSSGSTTPATSGSG